MLFPDVRLFITTKRRALSKKAAGSENKGCWKTGKLGNPASERRLLLFWLTNQPSAWLCLLASDLCAKFFHWTAQNGSVGIIHSFWLWKHKNNSITGLELIQTAGWKRGMRNLVRFSWHKSCKVGKSHSSYSEQVFPGRSVCYLQSCR